MSGPGVARRLAAILAADVAGYSRLMGADEEGTHAALKAHRAERIDPHISACNGHVVKVMGDGILAEFASVVDAVRCAVAIQQAMAACNEQVAPDRRIEFRIGVNLGDIIAEGDDIYGDGVNVTARLEGIAEPGGICISGTVYEHVRGKLDLVFDDLGEHRVKNIAHPVRVYRVSVGGEAGRDHPRAAPGRARGTVAAVAGLTVVVGLAAYIVLWPRHEGPPGVPAPGAGTASGPVAAISDRPSIAVLPFTNMSNDAEQEYFSDGVTEDLITDLSRLSGLFVIARNTVFTYKGRAVDIRDVARELGVRYVLEGSVRRAGERIRINAQLIDAESGGHIWAERFDREFGDIFALQDDVTRQIVSALELKLTTDEIARLRQSDGETSPEVYDLYLRGVEALRRYTPESIVEARTYFLKALARDPDYARGHAAMAFTFTASGIFFRSENVEEAIADALRYASRALALDAALPQGHFAMAIALLRQGRHDEALAAARNAVKYDPNYADGYAALANVLFFSGDGQGAEAAMRHAMRLNPRYSGAYIDILGRAYFIMGNYDRAIAELRECVSRDPNLISCRAFLAATYALAGRVADAQWEAQEILGLKPGYTLETDSVSPQFRDVADRERYLSGLRLAGVPEN